MSTRPIVLCKCQLSIVGEAPRRIASRCCSFVRFAKTIRQPFLRRASRIEPTRGLNTGCSSSSRSASVFFAMCFCRIRSDTPIPLPHNEGQEARALRGEIESRFPQDHVPDRFELGRFQLASEKCPMADEILDGFIRAIVLQCALSRV